MSWREGFYQAVKEYLELPEACVVTSVEDNSGEGGGCETCYYTYNEVIVYYTDENGLEQSHGEEIKLAEFINRLY